MNAAARGGLNVVVHADRYLVGTLAHTRVVGNVHNCTVSVPNPRRPGVLVLTINAAPSSQMAHPLGLAATIAASALLLLGGRGGDR